MFGAQAVSLHGFPRATADLDITIDASSLDVNYVIQSLRRAGFDPRFDDDVVLAGPGLEQRFLDEVEVHRIGRRKIPVLSMENLVVTKVLAGRKRDLDDVRELLALRDREIDYAKISETLRLLEVALDEHDLRPRFKALKPTRRR